MKNKDPKINIIVSERGVEKVQILNGIANQKRGLRLYSFIAKHVQLINQALKEHYKRKWRD